MTCLRPWLGLLLLCAVATGTAQAAEPPVRIHVPLADLPAVRAKYPKAVLLGADEYRQLQAAAEAGGPGQVPPQAAALRTATYTATMEGEQLRLVGQLEFHVLSAEPIDLMVPFTGVGFDQFRLGDTAAPLWLGDKGMLNIRLPGRGLHKVAVTGSIPLRDTPGGGTQFSLNLPGAVAGSFQLKVPGDQEIRANVPILREDFDAAIGTTTIELAIGGQVPIHALLLGNGRREDQRAILIGNSAATITLDASGQVLDLYYTLQVLRQGVRNFTFLVDVGWTITEVTSPDLVRWSAKQAGADGQLVEVGLRSSTTGTKTFRFKAHAPPAGLKWSGPRLVLQGADFQRGHLMVDPGVALTFRAETRRSALRQDLSTAARIDGLTSSNGRLFFHWGDAWAVDLVFAPVALERHSQETQILAAAPEGLSLNAQFEVAAVGHQMTNLVFQLPTKDQGWELSSVRLDGKDKGFEYRVRDLQGSRELRMDLAKAIPPEGLARITLVLKKLPAGWSEFLAENSKTGISGQTYPVIGLEAAKTKGLVAFAAHGHLEVDAGAMPEGWTPVNVGQLGALGLGDEVRSAMRYMDDSLTSVPVSISRSEPRLKASSVGLYTVDSGSFRGAFRFEVEVSRAPAQRFFILAEKELGQELSLTVKGHRFSGNRIVTPGPHSYELSPAEAERYNLWQLDLDEQASGAVLIEAHFRKGLGGDEQVLPLVRLAGTDQRVEFAAVEAGEEFKVQIEATGTREVDTIDLPTLPVPARRILAAHRFLPEASQGGGVRLVLRSGTLDNYAIPSVLALQTALRTQVGVLGSQQTEVRWRIANVSEQFLKVQLPEGSELWSAQIRDEPVKPKTDPSGSLRLPMPLSREPVEVQVVYFLPGNGGLSGLKLLAPELPGVALNRTTWEVVPPEGYWLADYQSSLVAPQHQFKSEPPLLYNLFKHSSFGLLGAATPAVDGMQWAENEAMDFEGVQEEMPAAEMPQPAEPVQPQGADKTVDAKAALTKPVAKTARPKPASPEPATVTWEYKSEDAAGVAGSTQTRARGRFTLPVQLVLCDGAGSTFNGLGEPELSVTCVREQDDALPIVGFLVAFVAAVFVWRKVKLLQKLAYLLVAITVGTLFALWIPSLAELVNGYVGGTLLWGVLWPIWALGWKLLCWLVKLFSKTAACRFLCRQFFRVAWGCLAVGLAWPNLQVYAAPQVFIPYGKEGPTFNGTESRVLLPYDAYVRLWNRANPEEPLSVSQESTRIFLREPVFQARLVDEDTFELGLRVQVEVDAPAPVNLPLAFGNVAVKEVLFAGTAASVTARKGGGVLLHLQPGDTGLLEVRTVLRPEVRGRAGSVQLNLPPMPAATLEVSLGDDGLELEAPDAAGQPVRKAGSWQLPVGGVAKLQLRWRPEVGAGSEDRTLAAGTSHQVHLFHWGLLGVSHLNYQFSGGERDRFHILLPAGARISRLETANLREHRLTNEVTLDGQVYQSVEVRLHRPVKKQLALSLRWIAPFPEEAVSTQLHLPRAGEVGRESGRVELHAAMGVGLKVESVQGGRRINRASAQTAVNASADASRFKGSYEWPFRPFALSWQVERETSRPKARLRQLVRVTSEEVQLLGNVEVQAQEGLLFGSTFLLPVGYEVLNVVGPDIERWHIQEEGMGNLLHVDYRVARLKTSLAVVLVNEAPALETFDVPLIRATSPEGQLLEEQAGQLAVQVAPALEARTLEARNLRSRPRSSVAGWLDAGQIKAVQFAYDSEGLDAALKLGIRQRPSKVRLEMLVGVLVEETLVHYTYRLRYNVEGSSLDRLRFTLPEAMAKDVALASPALRGIQHGAGENRRHWWEVSLVNEVTGLVDIGVNFSRQITPDTTVLEIPELRTEATAGYRVVVAVQNFSRHQLEFQGSARMRAATLEEQQELLDESVRNSLQFVHQSFQPRWEAGLALAYAQEAKRLEAVIDLLSMRTFVGKSGRCVYEVTLSLQNRAEQFIELEIPETLRLWSAEVDGQAVKPVHPQGAAAGRVAVPLVKTTIAGLPFDARLFLAGTLGKAFKPGQRVQPPAVRVVNIPVKRTNWSLYLPESFDYLDPKGNMNPVAGTTELLALGIEAKLDQLKRISMNTSSKMRYGKKEYWLKESLGKELAQLEKQIAYNSKDLEENWGLRGDERGRLGEQLSQQKQALRTLNKELTNEGQQEGGGEAIVNGYINATLVNPGISEWDRNGALNVLPDFVSSAQDVQVANLNDDIQSNSALLNNPEQARAQPNAQPMPQRQNQQREASPQNARGTQAPAQQSAQVLIDGLVDTAQTDFGLQQRDISGLDAGQLLGEAGLQQQITVSGGTILSTNGRVQQLAKRQEFLNSQLGNLADNRLNRFYYNKGRNYANALNQVDHSNITSGQVPVDVGGVVINGQLKTPPTGKFKSRHGQTLASEFSTHFDVDSYSTASGNLAWFGQAQGGGGGGGGAGGGLGVYSGTQLGLRDTGTYSLQIDFPEGGRQLDFSYPGDAPVISLRIRDTETRQRNLATLGLLAGLGLAFGASRIIARRPRKNTDS